MTNLSSTQRFSDRVNNYVKYRPSYPSEVIKTLQTNTGLKSNHLIADIGSGTGLLSQLFLNNNNIVYGVEPNEEMRLAAEQLYEKFNTFNSVPGQAEATLLKDQSVDYIVVGQSYHWFDSHKTKPEFMRILKPNGWVVLVWNIRNELASEFMKALEDTVHRWAVGKITGGENQIIHKDIEYLFGAGNYHQVSYKNYQFFNLEGLIGRTFSSSYTPKPDHPNYQPMLTRLKNIFDFYQDQGKVAIEYDTQVFYGQLF